MSKRVQRTIKGPGGISLHLDSSEINREDPGQGTPAILACPKDKETSPFWTVQDTGWIGVDGEGYRLSEKQLEWIEEMAEEVHYFMEIH